MIMSSADLPTDESMASRRDGGSHCRMGMETLGFRLGSEPGVVSRDGGRERRARGMTALQEEATRGLELGGAAKGLSPSLAPLPLHTSV